MFLNISQDTDCLSVPLQGGVTFNLMTETFPRNVHIKKTPGSRNKQMEILSCFFDKNNNKKTNK